MIISIKSKGDYRKIKRELRITKDIDVTHILDKYGRIGVERLANATPVRTGATRDSWKYRVVDSSRGKKLVFYNTNRDEDCTVSVAILIVQGHVTLDGTWVSGNDFVTDIIEELCSEIKNEI